jgi:aspartyl/asparaginyl beta-hydroxylase (cupin superfamily)
MPDFEDFGTLRFLKYIKAIASKSIDPSMGSYPDLPPLAWIDPTQVPLAGVLESNFAAIRAEILQIPKEFYHPESELTGTIGEWTIFPLFEPGVKNAQNCDYLPFTTALIEEKRGINALSGATYISRLGPQARTAPHKGPGNIRVLCHLGIDIPDGDCGIRVGGETRTWATGKCLALSDQGVHEAWNHTDKERTVLIVDVWNPLLTETEIELLTGLHLYTSAKADSLQKWREHYDSSRNSARP